MIFRPKKLFMLIVLLAFLSLSFFGLSVHGGMSSEISMTQGTGCPFMLGEYSLCAINTLDHISAWQNATTGMLSKIFYTTAFASSFIYIVSVLAGLLASILLLILYQRLKYNLIQPKQPAILHWLSLLENSPSPSLRRY